MLSLDFLKGQKVAVYGLGRSGLSVALALKSSGAIPLCWDDSIYSRKVAESFDLIIKDMTLKKNWIDCVLLLLSPGIPYIYPTATKVVQQAWRHNVPVDNDVGLFFKSYLLESNDQQIKEANTIAVTGSNGKSTTSSLIHHVLNQKRGPAQIGGNIGTPLFDLKPASLISTTVIELSSYQIEVANLLNPKIAVFLNFSEDHLDRHAGVGGYFAAKRRLFSGVKDQVSIVGVDEKEGRAIVNDLLSNTTGTVITISNKTRLDNADWSVFSDGTYLFECKLGTIINEFNISNIPGLMGAHNLQNVCAAYAVCRVLQVGVNDIINTLKSYQSLPHRIEIISTLNGVTFVNDSKATNAVSTLHALKTFSNIHWIAGGREKGDGIHSLIDHLHTVKKAYLIGESAVNFSNQLGDFSHTIFESMEAAVSAAFKDAKAGDVILLSPAAASFDKYSNFEERGIHFSQLVKHLE